MSQVTKDVDYDSVAVGLHRGYLSRLIAEGTPRCSSSFLLQKWGEPDVRASLNDDISVWTYHNGLKWVGASPVVILPLPFFVPVGREEINFGIHADRIVFIKHETTKRSFVYLPLIMDSDITVGLYMSYGNGTLGCVFNKELMFEVD